MWGKSALAREGESSGSGVAAARATFSATGRVAPTTTRPKAPPAQHCWVTHRLRLDGYMFFECLVNTVYCTFCKCTSCRFLFLQFFRNRSSRCVCVPPPPSLSQLIMGQTLPFCIMLRLVLFFSSFLRSLMLYAALGLF